MGEAPRNKATTAVYLVLRRGEKMLLARREGTGYADGNYQFPAGHIDAGELPTQALMREAKEELDITLSLLDLKLVHVSFRPMHDATGDRVDFYFEAQRWEGEPKNNEPRKCSDLQWFSPSELPQNVTPHVWVAIQRIRMGDSFSEISLDFIKAHGLYRL